MLKYQIFSPLPSNKTAQRNLQHYAKLHNTVDNEVHNVFHNKIILKN